MNTKELIGHRIKDILVWSKAEVGGLDMAEVFLVLDKDVVVLIPWDFETEDLELIPQKEATSVFAAVNAEPVYHINPESKTVDEVMEAERKRESSFLGRMKRVLEVKKGLPKEYRPYKIEHREDKVKHLKDQKIIDFLVFEDSENPGCLELENGFIITSTLVSPHGTGLAGLNYFESLKEFEQRRGTAYKRLTK